MSESTLPAEPAIAPLFGAVAGSGHSWRGEALPAGRYRLRDLMRSEWTKLATLRSTKWSIAITVLVGIGVSATACADTRAHWATIGHAGFDPARISLVGTFFGQLVLGVLGALVMSGEYGTGTIRATFSAAPRRVEVLLAKVAVFGAFALIVAEAIAVASFLVGQALLSSPAKHVSLADGEALRATLGTGLYLGVIGLLGLAIATLVRHTAGSISVFVAVLLVFPGITAALPQSWQNAILPYLPANIGQVMVSAQPSPPNLAVWTGFAVLCAYVVGLLVIGAVLLVRRDA